MSHYKSSYNILRPAEELREDSGYKRVIRIEVREILNVINKDIIARSHNNKCNLEFKLPKNYSSVRNDPDAVLLITTGVLQELLDTGYTVSITDIGHSYVFDIVWSVQLKSDERNKLKSMLEKHTKKH